MKVYVQPPSSAREFARRGLAARGRAPKSKKCCLTTQEAGEQGIGSGIARARDIIAGKRVDAVQVKAYFARHEGFYRKALERANRSGASLDEAADTEPAIQGWWIWGGDPMRKSAVAAVNREMSANPRSSEIVPSAKTLGKALARLASSDASYYALQNSSLGRPGFSTQSAWLHGGCFAFARAFYQWAQTGELVGIDADKPIWGPGHEHVMVKIGNRYYDALGSSTKSGVLRYWSKAWTFPNFSLKPSIVPFSAKEARSIKCPYGLVQTMTGLMKRELGDPKDWGLEPAEPVKSVKKRVLKK